MGVVHYRYRSGVQTFSLPIPGAFASVAELKRLIAATGRHGAGRTRGRGPRDGVALCDPGTGEGACRSCRLRFRASSTYCVE
jgi:E3 ubiquitin-protein ligase RBBP6